MADPIVPIKEITDTSKTRVVTFQGGRLQHAPWPIATLTLTDGITAPAAVAGQAILYVDGTSGDLKVVFGDGVIKTIVTDT